MLVHTRNVVNQPRSWTQEGRPQDLLTTWLAEEEGESERRSVMERIGVAEQSNITPPQKRADFPLVFQCENV